MQDNRKHIDKAFVDQAWGNMRIMLDQEMPLVEGKRKRRFIWGWWGLVLAGLLVSSTALGIAYWNKKEATSHPDKPAPSKAIALTPSVPDRPNAAGTNEPSTASTHLSNNKPQPVAAQTARKQRLTKDNSIPKQLTIKQGAPMGLAEQASTAQLPAPPISTVLGEYTFQAPNPALAHPIGDVALAAQAPARIEQKSLHDLAVGYSDPTFEGEFTTKKAANWHFGFEGNGMGAIRSQGVGFSANLFASRNLASSRWSFNAGLGYAYLEQPLSVVITHTEPEAATNTDMNEEVEYGIANSSTSLVAEKTSQGIRTDYDQPLHLHYAVVPISLSYRLGARLRLSAGIQSSFLLFSKSEFTEGGFFDQSSSSIENYSIRSQPFKVSFFDVSANGSIGFLLNQRASVELGYKLGLFDVLPNNSLKDKNRMTFLGMRYQF